MKLIADEVDKKKRKDKKTKSPETEESMDDYNSRQKKTRKNKRKGFSDEDDTGSTAKKFKQNEDSDTKSATDFLLQQEGAFTNFKISEKTIAKLQARGVTYLFPIQSKTFDFIYDGLDVIAQARTGTGKTFSFAVPLVEKLQSEVTYQRGRPPKVLVMAPTRELAKQICNDFDSVSDTLCTLCVYGGSPYGPQEMSINHGLDIIVGTPGRLLDLAQKGTLDLSQLKHVVLDEVDRMLDMGFADSVEEILKFAYKKDNKEHNPQTLLFSATVPNWVHNTAKQYMKDTIKTVDTIGTDHVKTAKTVQHLAIKCGFQDRASTIGDIIQVYSGNHGRCMVFSQTKRACDELAVSTAIKQETHVLHGDIPQDKREMVLKKFREGRYKCLITTDVAARGLDIPEVDLVIQCAPPKDWDSYIHRSGRTGRAGRQGTSVCFYNPREERDLQMLEQRAGIKFKRIGAPTPDDIINAAANDAVRALDSIPPATLAHFKKSAERLVEDKGAVTALAAALAVISGSTEIKSRSLLNSYEGFTTYLFRTNIVMERIGYAWRAIERKIPPEVKDKIVRMRFTADKMGCVFDLPYELDSVIEDHWSDGKFDTLVKATELPELLDSIPNEGNSSWGNSGNRSWGRGGGGGNYRGQGSYGGGQGNYGGGGGQGSYGRGGQGYRGGDQGGFGRGGQGHRGRGQFNHGGGNRGYQSRGGQGSFSHRGSRGFNRGGNSSFGYSNNYQNTKLNFD